MSQNKSLCRAFLQRGKGQTEELEEEPTTSKKKKDQFNRHQESYLKYEFVATGSDKNSSSGSDTSGSTDNVQASQNSATNPNGSGVNDPTSPLLNKS